MANKYYVTPKGAAGYPKLLKPDTKFSAEGVYSTNLTMSLEDAQPLLDQIKEVFEDEFGPKKTLTPSYTVNKEEGTVTFKVKSKSKPVLYDSKGNLVLNADLKIGSGSIIKVKGSMGAMAVQGKFYVTLYMNSVQIIDLIEYNADGFGAEEGGFVAAAVAKDHDVDAELIGASPILNDGDF